MGAGVMPALYLYKEECEVFSATDFTYDGINSGVYGLQIATIDGSVVEETTYVTPTITTSKSALGKRFYFLDSVYDQQPTTEFSVLSETAIPDLLQRDILKWLDNRKGFKDLIINQPEFNGYVYKCIFNVTSIIYHAGVCVGFNLKATFDSPYHYKNSPEQKITGTGETKEISIYNDSDLVDEYVYPTITFKPTNYVNNNCSISIFNKTDDPALSREFKFVGTALNSKVKVDNELRMITSEAGGDLLSKFDGMKWLRLVKGKNVLQIKINGEFTISFPQYIKIRF